MRRYISLTLLCITCLCSAQPRIDSLKKILANGNKDSRIPALLELCWEYRYSKPDTARKYGFEALEAAMQKKMPSFEAEALHNLAITYEAQGNYQTALNYNFRALKIRKLLADSIKTANTLNNIGISYDELGNFTLALKYYNEAYQIYKKLNDREKLAMVTTNLGILFKGHEDFRQAIAYYKEAYAIYKTLKMPLESAFTEANLGSGYHYTHQYDSCLYYSLKAAKVLKEQHILQFLPVTYANAGIAYFELGNTAKALELLQSALTQHARYGNKKEMSFCNIHLARIMMKQKNNAAAQAYLKQAISLGEQIGASKQVMDAQLLLADVYRDEKDFERAYQAQQAYGFIKDSLFRKEKTRLITEFQTKYETEKKEQQIVSLNQQNTIQQLKIRQRTVLLLIAVALLLAGAIITYLLNNRRKLKAEARLQTEINKQQELTTRAVLDAEERERRRIATDLHDGVGQILSAALMNLSSLFKKLGLKGDEETQAQRSLNLVTEGYSEMRTISHQMMPNALLKAGLASAVKDFLNHIDENQIKVSLETVGLTKRLDEQVETVLYRVIQETVNNVIKHASASKLTVQIIHDTDSTSVTIEDNGKGFDSRKLAGNEGIGLKNIRSRVELLKGIVDIDSTPGKGTMVAIHIPA
ncbi:tetratricopeptide repeat protein (plasmid) [Pedobacter sp. BS3]|uniref:tetratricopeptide repeat-containing sensor histidine kinase n=1 Tax=Pedobacter sp. BS3 TaxID=2567937 RepID=UPI0011F04398|nr:tetratricopeptide repeat protein [Pedobacter sp. BS3]TZF86387.1 tetratricopeptide repeat protein [Pedobacter sp. BS3]